LNAARIEQIDKLAGQIPQPESFFVQVLKEVEAARRAPVSTYVQDEKHLSQLGQMAASFNVQLS